MVATFQNIHKNQDFQSFIFVMQLIETNILTMGSTLYQESQSMSLY